MFIVVILSRDTPKATKNGRGEGKEGKDRKRNVATINGQEEVNSSADIWHASQMNQGISYSTVIRISDSTVYHQRWGSGDGMKIS